VLVLGGSYAGLSAALNLIDLCHNRDPRCGKKTEDPQDTTALETIVPDITIVDERDGFCKSYCRRTLAAWLLDNGGV